MKNKAILSWLTILLMFATSAALVSIWSKGTSAPPIILSDKKDSKYGYSLNNPKNIFFQSYSSLIIPSDGSMINPSTIVQDTNYHKQSIASLTNSQSVLIFRYSYMNCDMCVDLVMQLLEKEFDNEFSNRVIIITDSYSDRDFKIKAAHKKSDFHIYDINGETGLHLRIENKNLPFLFVLDKNFRVTKIFIPFKEMPQKTKEYLSYIHQYLNHANKE